MSRGWPILVLACVVVAVLIWRPAPTAPPPTAIVRSGDTLGRLARKHDVSVADLRAWNDIDGDLIQVGDSLRIGPKPPSMTVFARLRSRWRDPAPTPEAVTVEPAPSVARTRTRAVAAPQSSPEEGDAPRVWAPLSLPPAKPCLDPYAVGADGDRGVGRSIGLDPDQVRAGVDAFQAQTLRCADEHPDAGGDILLELAIGCDGRVLRVEVVDDGVGVPGYATCVADVMKHASFPAHARDEVVTRVPLRFSAAPQ
jgi:LysM repeat protein